MNVTVKMFGNLRRHLPQDRELLELAVPAGTRVEEVIRQLGVDGDEVGLAVVNGEVVPESTALREGDLLELFAIMAGGAFLGRGLIGKGLEV